MYKQCGTKSAGPYCLITATHMHVRMRPPVHVRSRDETALFVVALRDVGMRSPLAIDIDCVYLCASCLPARNFGVCNHIGQAS